MKPLPAPTLAALRARLSNASPAPARITLRTSHPRGPPVYTILIGKVIVPGVKLVEIFDYVSPQDFEAFEHEILKRETAKDHLNHLEGEVPVIQKKRGRGRPRKDGLAGPPSKSSDDTSGSDGSAHRSSSSEEPTMIQHEPQERTGRPRPSYQHLYMKQQARQAKAVAQTGQSPPRRKQPHEPTSLTEATTSLSLDEGPKRRKLVHESTSGSTTSTHRDADKRTPEQKIPPAPEARPSASKELARITFTNLTASRSTSRSSAPSPEPSPEPSPVPQQDKSKSPAAMIGPNDAVSIASPTKSRSASGPASDANSSSSNGNGDDDDASEEEYEIEEILSHFLSDPRTHQRALGKEPVMLFQVKWVGYVETTWEPISSFPDRDVVEQYWRRVEAKKARKAGQGAIVVDVGSQSG